MEVTVIVLAAMGLFAAFMFGNAQVSRQLRDPQDKDGSGEGPASAPSPTPSPVPGTSDEEKSEEEEHPKKIIIDSKSLVGPRGEKTGEEAVWIPKGKSVTVAEVVIPGGMIYVGNWLNSPIGVDDSCCINPALTVAPAPTGGKTSIGSWPSYAGLMAGSRRDYLEWLAGSRQDPHIDIGFVLLYLAGLERRAIWDTIENPAARSELPSIATEVKRLLGVYGNASGIFRFHAWNLLEWIDFSLLSADAHVYEKPLPAFPRSYLLPVRLRYALGQVSQRMIPLQASLALSWYKAVSLEDLNQEIRGYTDLFDRLFLINYQKLFKSGLVLPRTHTKMKLVYYPVSVGMRASGNLSRSYNDMCDVSFVPDMIARLKGLAEDTLSVIVPYAKWCAEHPDAAGLLEAKLQLPLLLWSDRDLEVLRDLKSKSASQLVITVADLLALFENHIVVKPDEFRRFAKLLEDVGIGMEPDVLSGIPVPTPESKIILFKLPSGRFSGMNTETALLAFLNCRIVSTLWQEGGDRKSSLGQIWQKFQTWQLDELQLRRIEAHIKLLSVVPISLSVIKKSLSQLDVPTRECIAMGMAVASQVEGTLSQGDVRQLETICRILSVPPAKVFTDSQRLTLVRFHGTSERVKLDPERVNLCLEGRELAAGKLRAALYPEKPYTEPAAERMTFPPFKLLGLDEPYSTFMRVLLSRPEWSRSEIHDLANDLSIENPSEALEYLNKITNERYERNFTEGEERIIVDLDILEQLESEI